MMATYIFVGLAAFLGSILTFYSGFGLGTLLTPVFVLFFPIEMAIAMTGIVHLLNNIFKLRLTFRNIDFGIVKRFGIPAIVASFFGAWFLGKLSVETVAYQIDIFGTMKNVTTLNMMLAILMIIFVILELVPRFRDATFSPALMPIGGLLSGFFGGLAGFQGALRSMFLSKSGLSKEAYIATGIIIACFIDLTRLGKYSADVILDDLWHQKSIILTAILCALLGAYLGHKWLKKVTFIHVQRIISFLLLGFAICLLVGIL